MRVLWDVDIEIDCLVPSEPLVDGDHVIVAGGEHALLARIHRETGTVENALFTVDTDVEVSAPVRVPALDDDEAPARYAFASIDRPRLHLNITIVDEHMRVCRARDISADDPDTPELLVDGRISHFSAHVDSRGALFVVAVREPELPQRAAAPLSTVRCVWDDLVPAWSQTAVDVHSAQQNLLVCPTRFGLSVVNASDGRPRWSTHGDLDFRNRSVVRAGPGVIACALPEDVEVYETLRARIEVFDITNGKELTDLTLPASVDVRDVIPRASFFTSVWRRGRNTYALLHSYPDGDQGQTLIDVAHAPRLLDGAHALVGDELIEWRVGAAMTRLPLGLTSRARATIADDVAFIRDGKRLLAIALA